jgi:hypothetical protein
MSCVFVNCDGFRRKPLPRRFTARPRTFHHHVRIGHVSKAVGCCRMGDVQERKSLFQSLGSSDDFKAWLTNNKLSALGTASPRWKMYTFKE